MTAAMVLAAGLGTRLRPLTDELPKPLMPVGDRTALAHVVEALARAGVERVVVNTHHLADRFAAAITALPVEAHVVHEPAILGTAGGIANAASLLGEGDVVVWNGDILAPELDVAALVATHRAAGAAATWVVAPRARGEGVGGGVGTVGLGADGRVVRLRGRVFGEEVAAGDFLGVSLVGEGLRRALPASGCLVADVALPLLARGGRIATHRHEAGWEDIGTPAALLEANVRWLERAGKRFHRGDGATVAPGVALERSVVAAGGKVEGEGALERVVVLPGGRAVAPLRDAIVGRTAVVPVRRA